MYHVTRLTVKWTIVYFYSKHIIMSLYQRYFLSCDKLETWMWSMNQNVSASFLPLFCITLLSACHYTQQVSETVLWMYGIEQKFCIFIGRCKVMRILLTNLMLLWKQTMEYKSQTGFPEWWLNYPIPVSLGSILQV